MADFLGPIAIPVPPKIAAFPFNGDYGTAEEIEQQSFAHRFDSPGLKTEQRFFRGPSARRFRVVKALNCHDYEALRDHWNLAKGVYARFDFGYYNQAHSAEIIEVRYADPTIQFEHLAARAATSGIVLIEALDSAAGGSSTSVQLDDGIPSATLVTALRKSELSLVPLVQIASRDGAFTLYLSDRRYTLNGFLYLPRLLGWGGLTQAANQNNDSATFRFGNADGVWTELLKTANMKRARIAFGFFEPTSQILFTFWSGNVRGWSIDPATRSVEFGAADGIYELTLPYPTRQISRTCWKEFRSPWCPYVGALLTCDKSWEQCQERAMTLYFGGEIVKPAGVYIKDNSTGTWGFGRSRLRSVTAGSDTIYQRVLQEIYTDTPIPITCDIAGGRDEGDFYAAIGIVGEGPITGFSTDIMKHTLDGSPPHDPAHNGGLRVSRGLDPATTGEFFSITQAPWNSIPPGSTYAAGTAFAEARRTDEKGLQLSKLAERELIVTVTGGMGGWTWTAPGARSWTAPLTNLVWVAVNVFLRGIGIKADYSRPDLFPAATMEAFLRLDKIIPAAAICELPVTKLVGEGTERQFPFRGVLKEQKALRDWLKEICDSGLAYYYFLNSKLAIGIRANSSVLAGNAFTPATVLQDSYQAAEREPGFNHLTVEFGDEEFDWKLNSSQIYDIDAAKFEGSAAGPRFRANRLSLPGVSGKSQASRIGMTLLKEELGGATVAEQAKARAVRFRSTVIALSALPGDVCSFHVDPDFPLLGVEFRITSRTLNADWSMDFEGVPSTDSMYDVVAGPKPDDVPADRVPPERFQTPQGLAWLPNLIAPFAGDPMYGEDELTFSLMQDYNIERTGEWDAAIWVSGEEVVNGYQGYKPPMMYGLTFASGGSLAGGQTYYIACAQRDDSFEGRYSPLSNIMAVWIPPGPSVSLTIATVVAGGDSFPGHALWMGTDVRRMSLQLDESAAALPSSFAITSIKRQTSGLPWADARKIRIKAKGVQHSGVAGLLVQEVIGDNQLRSSEWIDSDDDWVGQWLSVLADFSDGSVPLWNFTITAFDSATGTITVDPPCVRESPADSVEADDVMVVRAKVTAATATTVTCAMWQNDVAAVQFDTDGLEPDAEIGFLVRILRGTGAGQTRLCTGNDHNTHTIDPPWEIVPDATSVIIVEDPEWVYTSETSTPDVELGRQTVDIRVRLSNFKDRVALVGGFLVDSQENETFENLAVYREIYVFGQPPGVREVESAALYLGLRDVDPLVLVPEDQTVKIKTVSGEVREVHVPNHIEYFGRTLRIVNDGDGQVLVKSVDGVLFQTGADSVLLTAPGEMLEITAA